LPLSLASSINRVTAEGGESAEGENAAILTVGPRYFETVGTPLLAGVDFPPAASTASAVIVNQELARRLYPGQSALGRRVSNAGHWAHIIGVAANSKYQMLQESEAMPILYEPILDGYAAQGAFGGITLMVRFAQDPAPLGNVIRQQILRRDPELVVNLAGTMESHVREALFLPRLAASLFGLCGSMGLLIASIGVYGVISFAVARRAREIGIRMALGARASQIVKMVLWQGAAVVLVGIVIGVAGGFALARAAGSLIYGVSATDPVTFIGVPVILLAVGLLATAIPARRAAMVDPNRTLRTK
jgi:ABC-type antimicrobial peptide transport system permease subunit